MEEIIIIETENFQITQTEFYIRILLTLGIGFVIGLEREHASLSRQEEIFAGLRTFVMVSLMGFLCMMLSVLFSYWILIAGLLGLSAIVSVSYWISASRGQLGGTTELTTFLVFILGALTFLGHLEISLPLTVIILIFLSLKVKFQSIVGRITQTELFAFIQFVIVVLLIFPFLPDQNLGPYNVINPREIGWVIVLTSGVGFVGYMLMKFLGTNMGILLTGIVGGLVSSTVVTWVFSKKSTLNPALSKSCAVAILAASTIMVVRVFIWISVFNPSLFPGILVPLLLILAAAFGITIFYFKTQDSVYMKPDQLPLGEPLNLRDAVLFGALYTGILLIVSYANDQFGNKGIYFSSTIAGLTDIDAITISVSKIAGDSIALFTAMNAIVLATISNTVVKLGIALWAGSANLRKEVLIGYGLMILAGITGIIIMNS